MSSSAAVTSPPVGDAPLSGVGYLDAWRAAVRPFPGSVPPLAGFDPVDDPVRDRCAGDADGEVAASTATGSAAAIAGAVEAVSALGSIDPTFADPASLAELVAGVEQFRRMVDAAATGVAAVIDARTPFRSQGYFNATTFLKQRAQLYGAEAHRRLQTARMRDRLPEWAAAAAKGRVGVAQSEAMGRVAANPRIDPAILTRDAGMLLDDAMNLPYTEFERNLRVWEALADPVGDDARNERARERREFNLIPRPDGGWNLAGFLPEPGGVEFAEIFGWYVEAEWQVDWTEARNRLGAEATQADLVRTEPQRRADALLAMARASVSRDPDIARPSTSAITVDILLDQHTRRPTSRAPHPTRADSATSSLAHSRDDVSTPTMPSMRHSSATSREPCTTAAARSSNSGAGRGCSEGRRVMR
jgi:hypothetical protein